MPATQTNPGAQIAAIWSRLQFAQRATILGFALAALAGLGSLVFFINRVDYEMLYRDLSPEDAQAIAAKLKSEKRDFLVSPDGSTIRVAAAPADVDKLRLEIAGSGLARSGKVGYEIFDKSQFGMTDFAEQVNYKRALEGELSRTISNLSEVAQARVHLVLPKDSLFEDKKEAAKASVLVRLRHGSELSQHSIAGIVNLVAGAVQGLQTSNVSVVDEGGKVLSRLAPAGGLRGEVESGLQHQIEKEMVAKVISILEPIVGKGKVHANASVELEFNSSEQTEETYNPNPPAILSQQKSEERVSSAASAAGVPGTRSNQSDDSTQMTVRGPERQRQSETTNYEVSRLVRHTVQPKGAVRRISVAVLLDNKTVYAKGQDNQVSATPQPRTKEELDACRELVLAAVGFNAERGDTVTLENIAFFNESMPQEETAPLPWHVRWQSYLIPGMKYLAFLVVFLVAYLAVFRPLRKRVTQSIAAATELLRQEGTRGRLPGGPPLALASANATALPAATSVSQSLARYGGAAEEVVDEEQIVRDMLREAELANPGIKKYEVLKKRVREQATKDPEQVSQLIRTWISEGR